MTTVVREGDLTESALIRRISAAGFYADPVMSWTMPDDATRLHLLEFAFGGLVRDYLPSRGVVQVLDDASVTFWRTPSFDYNAPNDRGAGDNGDGGGEHPFPDDVVERFAILDSVMHAAHPHDAAHWYLNVIATLPDRQGQGLGARILEPVLTRCDRDGVGAYLESSNPRNMTLYRRMGFVQTGELPLPDGPSLYPMWRDPRS
jgi:GNAT superfamily N-acetyltransferase